MRTDTTLRATTSGKTLVTGASGHVGANLVRRLLADGHEVRVLAQSSVPPDAFANLELERVTADLRDADAVDRAVAGCTRVFHVGAKVSTLSASAGETRELWETNVLGTRHVMRAALRHDVARVVLTGSFSAVGYDLDKPSLPSREEQPFYPFANWMPYAHSKVLAELELMRAVADGLDAVIAVSTAVVGPNDFMPSRLGKTMVDYAHGRLRGYVQGGHEFVSAKDLAEGHVLAMRHGKAGHRYIISTRYHTLDDLLAMFASVIGRGAPPIRIPAKVMAGIATVYSGALSRFFPNAPQGMTPGTIRVLGLHRHADVTKARTELGFEPTSVEQAVVDAYECFARRGVIPRASLVQVAGDRASMPRST